MDVSKFKLEIYDILAILVPGLILCFEAWITVGGWSKFTENVAVIGGSTLTLLLLVAFAMGHLAQELSDFVVKRWRGPRFFRAARDEFWASAEGEQLKQLVKDTQGIELRSADAAFDYCLTKSQASFTKRDVFLATSDLARALCFLSIVAVIPAIKVFINVSSPSWKGVPECIGCIVTALIVSALFWKRMVRFRFLSEIPVFWAYLSLTGHGKLESAQPRS